MEQARLDHKIILDMVEENSKVLDLGCGDGSLLALLKSKKKCRGTGIEIDEQEVFKSMEQGVSISQGDIDTALEDYSDKRFDYVILNESVQEILNPEQVLMESLRVGRRVIVGIPNFGYWKGRLQIMFAGRVPVTKWLPYKWYNTPNLRFLTLRDFGDFCEEKDVVIEQRKAINLKGEVPMCANLFAYIGIYLLRK